METIGRYRMGVKAFNYTTVNVWDTIDIIKDVVMKNKKARIEIRYDPSQEKNVRLVAATFDEDDTDEEFDKLFEF